MATAPAHGTTLYARLNGGALDMKAVAQLPRQITTTAGLPAHQLLVAQAPQHSLMGWNITSEARNLMHPAAEQQHGAATPQIAPTGMNRDAALTTVKQVKTRTIARGIADTPRHCRLQASAPLSQKLHAYPTTGLAM